MKINGSWCFLFVLFIGTAKPLITWAAPLCSEVFLSSDSVISKSRAAAARVALQALNDSNNPYSLSYDLRQTYKNDMDFENEIRELKALFLKPQNLEALNAWVKTEEHALFLYDLFNQVGLENFKNEIDYLHKNNANFIESHKSGNGLITYSFEKEGNTGDITLLFRPKEFTDEEWLETPENERLELLKAVEIPFKKFIQDDRIAPTGLKPLAVSGYSEELRSPTKDYYGWEISHKKYEINRQRLMRVVRDLGKMFKQTHSFHIHIVFELQKNDPHYENFYYWFKHINDYFYLKGLEEGLHGNNLTGVPEVSKDLKPIQRLYLSFRQWLFTSKLIPVRQNSLGPYKAKFFSVGLRAKIYGPASSRDKMKLGLELRDSTRNLDLLDHSTEQLTTSLSEKIWEKSEAELIKNHNLRLSTTDDQGLLRKVVSPEYAKLFSQLEPTAHFGLIRFEQAHIFNYRTGQWQSISPAARRRLREARAEYQSDLVFLERELRGYELEGKKTESELIQMALRMSLATWAKKARAAQFFSGY